MILSRFRDWLSVCFTELLLGSSDAAAVASVPGLDAGYFLSINLWMRCSISGADFQTPSSASSVRMTSLFSTGRNYTVMPPLILPALWFLLSSRLFNRTELSCSSQDV